ncbi:kinase-like domain-containing protein [Mycena latifolia]|nr:kinase-like domain-containing protein [Mycena latifolia]
MRPVDPRGPPLTLSDLECVRALGDGTDGQVMLVRARERASSTGKKLFALKAIRKKHLRYQDTGDFEGKNRERSALVRMPWSPFVTGILDTFTDDRNAYMMLEYTPCGSLSTIMARGAGKMSPAHMLFYFANIVCGLEHIHNKCGIVNRDVKPQNILVGADGYLTLCDFGPSLPIPPVDFPAEPNRWIGEGTALYNAPETLRLDGQPPDVRFGPAVDWWAAGIILYEMAAGQTPFALPLLPVGVVRDDDADSKLMFELMMAGPTDWPPNSRLGQKLRSLVKGLLTVNANGRLGLRDVMRHPWLATVDWTKMRRKRYLPPALGVPASDMSLYGKAELNPKHFPGLRFA